MYLRRIGISFLEQVKTNTITVVTDRIGCECYFTGDIRTTVKPSANSRVQKIDSWIGNGAGTWWGWRTRSSSYIECHLRYNGNNKVTDVENEYRFYLSSCSDDSCFQAGGIWWNNRNNKGNVASFTHKLHILLWQSVVAFSASIYRCFTNRFY